MLAQRLRLLAILKVDFSFVSCHVAWIRLVKIIETLAEQRSLGYAPVVALSDSASVGDGRRRLEFAYVEMEIRADNSSASASPSPPIWYRADALTASSALPMATPCPTACKAPMSSSRYGTLGRWGPVFTLPRSPRFGRR